jgi:hypothetical protein
LSIERWTLGGSLCAIAMMPQDLSLFGIPVDFVLCGVPLAGVAIFHQCTMRVALTELVTITIYKIGWLYLVELRAQN